MKSIAEELANLRKPELIKRKRGGNSELDAMVEEIEKLVPMTKKYDYGFWRKKLSEREVGYGGLRAELKKLGTMGLNKKTGLAYNKGATLVNVLKKYPIKIKTQTLKLFQ